MDTGEEKLEKLRLNSNGDEESGQKSELKEPANNNARRGSQSLEVFNGKLQRRGSARRGSARVLSPTPKAQQEVNQDRRKSTGVASLNSHRKLGNSEEERKRLQEDAISRLEKEKGRKLSKMEIKTTMRALVMMGGATNRGSKKRKSVKNKKKDKEMDEGMETEENGEKKEGENGDEENEEDDLFSDEDDEEGIKRLKSGRETKLQGLM